MKVSEARELNEDELLQKIKTLKRELLDLRMERSGGKLAKPHRMMQARREVARILTVLREKKSK